MHELSIALSIIDGVTEELVRQGGGRVTSVHLKVGPLSGVAKEALLFSYGLACEGTLLEQSTLVIEDTPLRIYCSHCLDEQAAVSVQRLECAQCGTPSARVTQGNELEIRAFELQT